MLSARDSPIKSYRSLTTPPSSLAMSRLQGGCAQTGSASATRTSMILWYWCAGHPASAEVSSATSSRSSRIPVDVGDRLGERRRRFLRDVVADAPQDAMRMPARVLIRVRLAVRERAVEIAADRDRRHRDRRGGRGRLPPRPRLWAPFCRSHPPPATGD